MPPARGLSAAIDLFREIFHWVKAPSQKTLTINKPATPSRRFFSTDTLPRYFRSTPGHPQGPGGTACNREDQAHRRSISWPYPSCKLQLTRVHESCCFHPLQLPKSYPAATCGLLDSHQKLLISTVPQPLTFGLNIRPIEKSFVFNHSKPANEPMRPADRLYRS